MTSSQLLSRGRFVSRSSRFTAPADDKNGARRVKIRAALDPGGPRAGQRSGTGPDIRHRGGLPPPWFSFARVSADSPHGSPSLAFCWARRLRSRRRSASADAAARMSSEKPDRLTLGTGARYELVKEIGRGGMGVAHLALAKGPRGFSKLVVLKMMKASLVDDPDSHRMFLEEARISARLAHPNVVQVHEVCDYRGTPTMVMEYLEGKPLSTILWEDGVPAPRNLVIYILTKAL